MDTQIQNTDKNKELAKVDDLSNWGEQDLSSQDIIVPMLLMMQYMSGKVKDQEAKFGEIRDSIDNKKLGGIGEAMEFIPFHLEKYWVEYTVDASGKNKTFSSRYAVTPDNEKQPISEPGIVRDYVWEFYGMLPGDMDGLPYAFPFRRTSAKAGRTISTQMYVRNRKAGKNPAAHVLNIKTTEKTGKDGDYAVAEVSVGRETTKEEQVVCLNWLKTIKSGAAAVDESHLDDDTHTDIPPVVKETSGSQREY